MNWNSKGWRMQEHLKEGIIHPWHWKYCIWKQSIENWKVILNLILSFQNHKFSLSIIVNKKQMRANLKRLPLEFVNSILVRENLREYSLSALIIHNTNSSNEDNTFLQHRAHCTSGTNDTKCTSLLLNFCKNYNIYTVAKLLYSGRVSRFQDNLDVFTACSRY